jgi:hypothetical protein
MALNPLFDTSILIDYLNGINKARREIGRYQNRAISIVTWMEVMAGATPQNEDPTCAFLANFIIFPLTERIAETAVLLRKQRRIKLPDAIVLATAQTESLLLITRNTKDFPSAERGVRIPYQL